MHWCPALKSCSFGAALHVMKGFELACMADGRERQMKGWHGGLESLHCSLHAAASIHLQTQQAYGEKLSLLYFTQLSTSSSGNSLAITSCYSHQQQ